MTERVTQRADTEFIRNFTCHFKILFRIKRFEILRQSQRRRILKCVLGSLELGKKKNGFNKLPMQAPFNWLDRLAHLPMRPMWQVRSLDRKPGTCDVARLQKIQTDPTSCQSAIHPSRQQHSVRSKSRL